MTQGRHVGTSTQHFVANLIEAKKRGKTLRSHKCNQCGRIIDVEFEPFSGVQTALVTCECGAKESVRHYLGGSNR